MTNDLMRKNAEKLRQNSTEIAKESERSIIDLETLQAVNTNLIQTLKEVATIQNTGRHKRLEAEQALQKLEKELKENLTQFIN